MMTGTSPQSGLPSAAAAVVALPFSVRVGTEVRDFVSLEASLRRHGRRFLETTFSPAEVEACGGYDAQPHVLAPGLTARLCAKEATLKVLRPTAILPEWREMEIVPTPGGWLGLELTGAAQQIAVERGLVDLQVSLSHDGAVAVATVIAIEVLQSTASIND